MTLKRVIAYTPFPWEHALTTLRISGPLEQAGLEVIQGEKDPSRVSAADAVLIQRDFPRFADTYDKIRSLARQGGKPIIYEIDDLLFELPEEHPYRLAEYFAPALLPMLCALMDADLVTTTTPLLQEYLQTFNPRTHVLPNYLHDQIWQECGLHSKNTKSPVVIGYMGSDSHLPDLEQLVPVFKRLLNRYGKEIQLRFWGTSPPPALRDFPHIEWTPLSITAYAEFAQYFCAQQCDIFVAPLADNEFNRCKSSIKFLEYSWLGVPGVYSSVAPYKGIVTHEQNGFLASTKEEWETCLAELIENVSLRQRMGQLARESAKGKFLLSHHAHKWKEVYQEAFKYPFKNDSALFHPGGKGTLSSILEQATNWQFQLQNNFRQSQDSVRELSLRLSEIKASDVGKLATLLWRLRLRIFPHGSLRERCAQYFLKYLKRSR